MALARDYLSISASEKDWIYSRCSIDTRLTIIRILRLFLRFLIVVACLPYILFSKNRFLEKRITGDSTLPACFVCTKNKERVFNVLVSTLSGFSVFNSQLSANLSLPDMKRLKSIITDSYRSDFYSIIYIAELYDFMAIPRDRLDQYSIYATSDGASPLNKVMCLAFSSLKKKTIRIVNHSHGPVVDENYSYNFLAESYLGEATSGWSRIKGMPWEIQNSISVNDAKSDIGIIGAPGPLQIFGVEYWMLGLLVKIKRAGMNPKVRLHPQAKYISAVLLKHIFRVDVSNHKLETEDQFIKSLHCLVTSYRTSLIDLAVIKGCPVILNGSLSDIDPQAENYIKTLSFQRNQSEVISNCVAYTEQVASPITASEIETSLPTIFDIIYHTENQ